MPKHSVSNIVHDVSEIHYMEKRYFKEFYKAGIRA